MDWKKYKPGLLAGFFISTIVLGAYDLWAASRVQNWCRDKATELLNGPALDMPDEDLFQIDMAERAPGGYPVKLTVVRTGGKTMVQVCAERTTFVLTRGPICEFAEGIGR